MYEKSKSSFTHYYEYRCCIFICRSVFYIWDYIAHPEVYAVQSAPWYTAMLLLGIYTLFVVVVCSVIKVVIKWRMKKSEGK